MKGRYIIACALASLVAIAPLSLVGASANTLSSTTANGPLETFGYIDSNAKYNPFGPYRLNYYSQYSDLVYGVDIPNSFEGSPAEWMTESDYGVFDILEYSNNTGVLGVSFVDFATNKNVPCINLQMNSDLFWLDSYRDWFVFTDAPCNVSLFVWYDTLEGERTYTVYSQDYTENEYDGEGAYMLNVYEMLKGFAEEVDEEYGFLDDNGTCFVRDFVMTFTPVEELTGFITMPLLSEDSEYKTLTQYYVLKYSHAQLPSPPPPVDEGNLLDGFEAIMQIPITFLSTDIIPNFSYGDLLLIMLGFIVFGFAIKLCFGG